MSKHWEGWTKKEEYELLQGVSTYGLDWLERKTGKSIDAIRSKAYRLYGGNLTRGSYSLREASRKTGYHKSQLKRAMRALKQKWKRTSATGNFLIYEEQLDELVDWLKSDYWCGRLRLYGCLWCTTSIRQPKGLGLCNRCFDQFRKRLSRAGYPLEHKDQLIDALGEMLNIFNDPVLELVHKSLSKGKAFSQVMFDKFLHSDYVIH